MSYPRVSPTGDRVAFFEHPLFGDDGGTVSVVDLQGHKQTLTTQWASAHGLAWAPSGDEVWFSANKTGIALELYGVNLAGRVRTILRVPGGLELFAIRDGRVMIAQGQRRRAAMFAAAWQKSERDLAIADWCIPRALSSDGRTALLEEEAEDVESGAYTIYLRNTDGSPPLRLGEGYGWDLSRDGKWVLAGTQSSPGQLLLLPTGAGEPRQVSHDAISHRNACLLSDGKRVAFAGVEAGHRPRIYVQGFEDAAPRPIGPEGIGGEIACSPTGDSVAVSSDQVWIVPTNGGLPHAIPNTERTEYTAGWSADGQSVYTFRRGDLHAKLYRVETATGKRVLVKEIAPADAAGAGPVRLVHTTADLSAYIYDFARDLNELYVVEGLK
jgi:Tol biopolymer transport system component